MADRMLWVSAEYAGRLIAKWMHANGEGEDAFPSWAAFRRRHQSYMRALHTERWPLGRKVIRASDVSALIGEDVSGHSKHNDTSLDVEWNPRGEQRGKSYRCRHQNGWSSEEEYCAGAGYRTKAQVAADKAAETRRRKVKGSHKRCRCPWCQGG